MSNTKSLPTHAKKSGAAQAPTLVLRRSRRANASDLAVPVAPDAFKALSASNVKAVVEWLGEAIARSKKSGRSDGFTVLIDAEGNPEISPLDATASDESGEEEERQQSFESARARGRIRAAEVLSRKDMLSADQMAGRLGISRVTVNARRQRNELLALDGAKRGFRFPDWQVDDDGKPIEAMPRLFELLGPSPWGVYRFLLQRHNALDGATAKDALRRGQTERVIDAAESLARGDFS